MSLTGTVWADTVWADVWGPVWGARKVAPKAAEAPYSGGYFGRGDRRTKKEIDELRQKLGILGKPEDNIGQEVAELLNKPQISPPIVTEGSQYFDEEAIAVRVAKIAKDERDAADLMEIARLLAVAERKRQEEEVMILRALWRLIA